MDELFSDREKNLLCEGCFEAAYQFKRYLEIEYESVRDLGDGPVDLFLGGRDHPHLIHRVENQADGRDGRSTLGLGPGPDDSLVPRGRGP